PGPIYEISSVEIAPGFSTGAERLIRASFKPAVGTTYSPPELEIMNRRLLDTGVFARMELEPVDQPDGTLALRVRGEEGMRTTLGLYGGYETFQGPIIGAEVRKVNFMNSGNSASAKAEYTGRGINASLKMLDPALFGSRYSLSSEVGAETFSIFDYDRNSLFGKLGLERRWNKHITSSLFGQYSDNKVESDELTALELGPDEYQLGSVGAALVFDYRNSPVVPTDGWTASASVTSSGGDVQFLRSEISFSIYQPLTKKLRVAASAKARAVTISGGVDELPIDLRLFNGGATSVRSFTEREMGVKSKSGTPLGGTASQVFSVELSYEVRPNLELALFGDAGSLSREEDNLFSSPSDLRYAIGLGIRYKLPIGPLRIDYGFNPDRKDGEDLGALHITFGFAF
ncbi:MAG: autotransporter assembly complex family protein, partial [Verrucomicrobium sp.]